MSDISLIDKIIKEKERKLGEIEDDPAKRNILWKNYLNNVMEIINSLPQEMQNDFTISSLLSDDALLTINGIENASIEYDGMDTIIKSCDFIKKAPKSMLQLPKNIEDIVVAGNVSRITRRNNCIILNITTRMVNLSEISTNYAIDFDKLEKNDGFNIGVIKKHIILDKNKVISYSELNYTEKMSIKYMKWFGSNCFFNVTDTNNYTREPVLHKAIEVLDDQDISLDSSVNYFDISSYDNVCQHLRRKEFGETAPISNDKIRYLNANGAKSEYCDTCICTIERDTLDRANYMCSNRVKTLIRRNKCL